MAIMHLKLACEIFSTNSGSSEEITRHSYLTSKELKRANDRLDEAERRIDETVSVLQAAPMLIKWLTECQANLEARLIDQEG